MLPAKLLTSTVTLITSTGGGGGDPKDVKKILGSS
jgi:hypothetical protein